MDNQELLQSMGQMLDRKFEPVFIRLDKMDGRLDSLETNVMSLDERLTGVEADVKNGESSD